MVPETRRSYLALFGTVAAGGVAGCLGSPTPEPSGEASTPTNTPDQPPSDTPAPNSTPSDPPTGPVRCTGEPVSVERSVNDEPGYGDDMEYFPSNGTVRIVTVRSGDEPRAFAEWSFEEWARFEAADVARPRAVQATADRLGTNEFGSGVGGQGETREEALRELDDAVALYGGDGDTVEGEASVLAELDRHR